MGPEGVDGNSELLELETHSPGHHGGSEFDNGIPSVVLKPDVLHVDGGRDVDDMGVLGLLEVREGKLGGDKGSSEVDGVHEVEPRG